MSIIGSELLLASSEQYQIERSLRFNAPDSAYLSRTFGTATDSTRFTCAFWLKRAPSGAGVFTLFGGPSNWRLELNGDYLNLQDGLSTAIVSLSIFRDPSAWYHVVWSRESNDHTFWINGVFQGTTLTFNFVWNTATTHQIGAVNTGTFYSGYLADVYFIDGQALSASSFGEYDSNGNWQPKAYTGTYGNNGYHLEFKTTSGTDTSGRGNNWTAFNFGTSGAGNDGLVDTPTDYGTDTGVGGEMRGNYCTLSTIQDNTTYTGLNGSLDVPISTTAWGTQDIKPLGQAYWEVTANGGTVNAGVGYVLGGSVSSLLLTTIPSGKTFGFTAETIGINTTYQYRNITDGGSWTFAISINNTNPAVVFIATSSGSTANFNAGQRTFAGTALSGYKCICTTNLSAPIITKPSTVMDVALWTGNGSARSITGLGFNPDLVWIKGRSGATDHALYDSVRGATLDLVSNSTTAETTQTQGLTAFNSDGFSLGTLAKVNTNAATYAGWTWDAGSSTVTNTSGTISSQVRANASAGFSIVTGTAPSGNFTCGHGLGITPSLVIFKDRDNVVGWPVHHSSVCLNTAQHLGLQNTNAVTSAANIFGAALPTSSVFGANGGVTCVAGARFVAYCFAPVAGYSAFGSYTGNGNANGPFVHLGFRPAVILIKMSSSTGNWSLFDYQRRGYNIDNNSLFPNLTNAESTTVLLDIVSNGFKIRAANASVNTNTGTYIYAAWAQTPFKYTRAR